MQVRGRGITLALVYLSRYPDKQIATQSSPRPVLAKALRSEALALH